MAERNWTHDQLLAALYVYAVEPFGRLHQNNSLIIRVADQIGRTPSALAMKACNFASFDPAHKERGVKGLSNASRADRDLWNEFVENSESVAAAATAIVEKNDAEVEEEQKAPEFIGETESRRDIVVRRAQDFFRKAVLTSYGGRCALSGIAIPELLNASHIIPWSVATDHRADPRNGIALNALYDRAFDRGLFTFTDELSVKLSKHLPADTPLMDIAGKRLMVASRWRPVPEFIDYHRTHVFKR